MLSLCPTLGFSLVSTKGVMCSSSQPPLDTLPLFLKKVTPSIDSNVTSSLPKLKNYSLILTALSPLRESFVLVGYELLPLLPNCRTGWVYDLMAVMGVLFSLKHWSICLQRWWKAGWTKPRRQTLTFYEYDRLNNNRKANGSSVH